MGQTPGPTSTNSPQQLASKVSFTSKTAESWSQRSSSRSEHEVTLESSSLVDEIRPHRFGGEGVLIGGQQQH